MQEKDIDTIIRLALTGEASGAELSRLRDWLAQSEENQEVFYCLQRIWNDEANEPQLHNADAIREGIWQAGVEHQANPFHTPAEKRLVPFGYYTKMAAIALLVLSLPLLLFVYSRLGQPARTTARMIEKSSPAGQKLKVRLPDGSVAWLNAGSRVRFAEAFAGAARTLLLEGEAYFEVKKDPHKPFIVLSGKVSTRAIGTAFNITAYPGDSLIQVALLSGKVEVAPGTLQHNAPAILVAKGEGILFNRSSHQYSKIAIDAGKVTAWQRGILIFEGDSFEGVKTKLRRWYGVDITVTGTPPHDWELTGRFTNERLTEMLESIRFGRDFTYDVKDKQLVFHF